MDGFGGNAKLPLSSFLQYQQKIQEYLTSLPNYFSR